MMSRALPLLLLFITFLFINAQVWQVTSKLDGGTLWLTVLLFTLLAVAFLLVRLPEEVDRTDDHVDDRFLLEACRNTPLEETCREMVGGPRVRPGVLCRGERLRTRQPRDGADDRPAGAGAPARRGRSSCSSWSSGRS